jgi:hypothetical protein
MIDIVKLNKTINVVKTTTNASMDEAKAIYVASLDFSRAVYTEIALIQGGLKGYIPFGGALTMFVGELTRRDAVSVQEKMKSLSENIEGLFHQWGSNIPPDVYIQASILILEGAYEGWTFIAEYDASLLKKFVRLTNTCIDLLNNLADVANKAAKGLSSIMDYLPWILGAAAIGGIYLYSQKDKKKTVDGMETYTIEHVNGALKTNRFVGVYNSIDKARAMVDSLRKRSQSFMEYFIWTGTPRNPYKPL